MIDPTRSPSRHALDLMEEAVSLLRGLPLASLVSGLVGPLPFVFVLLLYMLNLVHNPRASEDLVTYSVSLALLYTWLRTWQSVFAAELWQARSGTSVFGWTAKEWVAIARRHAVLSPVLIISLFLSAVLIFPFAWIYALHHNLTLVVIPSFGNGNHPTGKQPLKTAWAQARLWPGSNQLVILLLGLVGFVVFINFMSLLLLVPYLVKFLTGWESTFTRLGMRLMDLKIFVAAATLSYLALSPLVRAVYVLRCFYGLSAKTGEDLASELRRIRNSRVAALITWIVLSSGAVFADGLQPTKGVEATPDSPAVSSPVSSSSADALPAGGVSVTELDRSIDAVLQSPKHVWHAPQGVKSARSSLLQDFARALGRAFDTVMDWLLTVRRWLWPTNQPSASSGNRRSWIDIRTAATALLVVTAGVLLLVIVRMLLAARRGPKAERSTPVLLAPDLTTADVNPAELPEEGWLRLAAQMVDRGEMRLAIRALYLAALACLADRKLITATRFKSNRDYLRELQRKTRGKQGIVECFQPMIWTFERVWYGTHGSNPAELEEMRRLLEGLRSGG